MRTLRNSRFCGTLPANLPHADSRREEWRLFPVAGAGEPIPDLRHVDNDESEQLALQSAPFPGNVVPQSRITAMAKKVLAPLPNPNGAPSPTREGLNNYIYEAGSFINDYWSLSTRIDHNFNEKNRLFGRFGWSDRVLKAMVMITAKAAVEAIPKASPSWER